MQAPKITVLMPVYNGERYLKQAIKSILDQTFTDFEFLIINDGSTDKTVKIVKLFNDSRIRLINHRKNKGITRRLNEGLKKARGKYIARADADDIYHPKRLERQFVFLKKHKLILVGTWALLINARGKVFSYDQRPNDFLFIKWGLLFGNCFIHSSVLFKKNVVLKLGGYDDRFSHVEDYELWSRLIRVARIGILEENLCYFRIHKTSICKTFSKKQIINTSKVSQKNIEHLLGKKIGFKGCFLLKNLKMGKKLKKSTDIDKTFLLLWNIYQKFIKTYSPKGKALSLINEDYSQKLLKLLNVNNAFSKKRLLKIINTGHSTNSKILLEAYKKDKKLIFSLGFNLFLIKCIMQSFFSAEGRCLWHQSFIEFYSSHFLWSGRQLYRNGLYRLCRLSQALGFSRFRKKLPP